MKLPNAIQHGRMDWRRSITVGSTVTKELAVAMFVLAAR